jgi:tetratricopeptide (TPR) repeat protein
LERETAISILAHHWQDKSLVLSRAKQLILEDTSAEVRVAAIDALIHVTSHQEASENAQLLADIASNPNEVDRVRRCAYAFLLCLVKRSHEVRPSWEPWTPEEFDQSLIQTALNRKLRIPESSVLNDMFPNVRDAIVNIQQGLDAFAAGRYNDAAIFFTRLIAADPSMNSMRCMRGCSLAKLGNTDQAIDDFSVALAQNPNDSIALLLRSCTYLQKGMISESTRDYENAIRLNPSLA